MNQLFSPVSLSVNVFVMHSGGIALSLGNNYVKQCGVKNKIMLDAIQQGRGDWN